MSLESPAPGITFPSTMLKPGTASCSKHIGRSAKRIRRAWSSEHIEAAVRLQRLWRNSRAIRNDVDPLTYEPVPLGPRRFLLVESQCVAYKFDGPTLAASTLCSGSFEHPVLRRELTTPEVWRLGRAAGLGRFGCEALRVCFDYRRHVAKRAAELSSLVSFLESEAGVALNSALERGEFFDCQAVVDDGVAAYSDALEIMATARPCAVTPLVDMHKALVTQRRGVCRMVKEDLYDVMLDAKDDAEDRLMLTKYERPLTALGEWLNA